MMFYNAEVLTPLQLADDYTEGGKVIYINSNLKPSEAVRLHPELQVCAEIEQWARDSEALGELSERINTYSAEISDNMIGSKFLEEIYAAVNNGAGDEELYTILDRMQNDLDNALIAVNRNLDKIYELVNT